MTTKNELTNKSDKELTAAITEAQLKLKQLRISHAGGKLKNVREMRVVRKDIARAKTALSMRGQQK